MAKRIGVFTPIVLCTLMVLALSATSGLAETPAQQEDSFPRPLESYEDADGIWSTLGVRASAEPFNLVATLIFLLAIVHTFLAPKFLEFSHRWTREHEERVERGEASRDSVPHAAKLMHLLGEVEIVFGLWAAPLMIAIAASYDWGTAVHYVGETVDYTEAAFVVVIMTLAATRPIDLKVSSMVGLFPTRASPPRKASPTWRRRAATSPRRLWRCRTFSTRAATCSRSKGLVR